ncbi:uncharacterized protein B0T23DRAFT_412115 [Neurospora hispaniola]|uniref:Uncharacterized protein n=1 Tax=Neurospora hispaniola TaxID=588809 RepID=A0AAJ0IB83_9PEZI|nr:hypothetical protein B0T23DRAFT_412115 [Neurospora hispaniola]
MPDPRRPDRTDNARVFTAADLFQQIARSEAQRRQADSNQEVAPPYTFRPTAGEATIGFNCDTLAEPPSYSHCMSASRTHTDQELRSEEAVGNYRARSNELAAPAARSVPTESASATTEAKGQARSSGIPPPPYAAPATDSRASRTAT